MKSLKTADSYLKDWYGGLRVSVKTAFFATLLVGLMTHLYQFTNKFYNYDELANTPGGNGASVEQGRWFLKWMGDIQINYFGGAYSLPFLNGIVSVLMIAAAAALIASMFRMESKLLAACVGGFMVSFPSIVCMFFYMFTSVFYSAAIFLSVLCAYLVVRYPKNLLLHLAAVFALACSLGTYQAYFPNTVCLLVIAVIVQTAEESADWKKVFFTALRYVGVLAAGMIAYFLINKAVLAYYNVEMINYQGSAAMGQITVGQLLRAIKHCYRDFINLGFDNVLVLNATGVMRRIYTYSTLLLIGSAAVLVFFYRGEWIKKLFMALGFLVFPVAMFLVYVMAPDAMTYTLMGYGVVSLLIFLVVWADRFYAKEKVPQIVRTLMQWVSELLAVVMLVCYIWYGNGCYMSLEYTKMHDMSYFQTMVTQIKSVEGYSDEMKVVFIGNKIEDVTNNQGSLMGPVFSINGKSESNVNAFSRMHIITQYLGFAPDIAGYEETKACMEWEEVKNMPSYPHDGSIQIVNGIIVVKMSDYE